MPVIFLERLADGAGVLAPQERAIKLPAGWTVVDHPTDSLAGDPAGPGQVTGYLELVAPVPSGAAVVYPAVPTVAGETVSAAPAVPIAPGSTNLIRTLFLGCIQVPGASTVKAVVFITALLPIGRPGASAPATPGPQILADETGVARPFAATQFPPAPKSVTGAADNGSGLIRLTVDTTGLATGDTMTAAGVGGVPNANETWAVTVVDGSHVDLRGSVFAGAYTSGGTVAPNACVSGAAVGNGVQLSATGLLPARWSQSESVRGNDVRYDPTSGNTYICSQSGTTSNAGTGPAGTGTAIVDGTAQWDFVRAGRGCPITWTTWIAVFTAG